MKIYYLFDPLCGWCYGASPAVNALAKHYPVELLPTGLFFRSGRKMDADFAGYAWSNDQRIQKLTGLPFSRAYFENILQGGGDFDSETMLRALAAVRKTAPEQELAILSALQTVRYAEGRDNTDVNVIAGVLHAHGLADAAANMMTADTEQAVSARIASGEQLAQRLGVSGVPQLAVEHKGQWFVAPSRLLYGGIDGLRGWLKQFA